MNKTNSQRMALILALILIAAATSCGDTPQVSGGTTAEDTVETTQAETTVFNLESSGIEIKDFGGREFTILTNNVDNHAHTWRMLDPEEINGESLNDAMYNRNKKIEEKYNVEVSSFYSGSVANDISRSINAGDNDYAVAFGSINQMYPLAREGKFMNYHDLSDMNLAADYWDQSLIEGLTYKDSLYVLTGDISPALNSRVYTMVFNKDL